MFYIIFREDAQNNQHSAQLRGRGSKFDPEILISYRSETLLLDAKKLWGNTDDYVFHRFFFFFLYEIIALRPRDLLIGGFLQCDAIRWEQFEI